MTAEDDALANARHQLSMEPDDVSLCTLYSGELRLLLARLDRLTAAFATIEHSMTQACWGGGGELFPVGPNYLEYEADGNTLKRAVPPWYYLDGQGETLMDAVADHAAQHPPGAR